MDKSFVGLLRNNRIVRGSLATVGALFLGALGSGLWDLVLKDVLSRLGNAVLSGISLVWGGYVDVLHGDIGKLEQDILILPFFTVLSVVVMFIPWMMIFQLLRELSKLNDSLDRSQQLGLREVPVPEWSRRLRTKVLGVLVPLSALTTLLFAVIAWQTLYTRGASNWAARSIEILAPHIAPQAQLELRSGLRRVDNAEKFYRLYGSLNSIAAQNGIVLPGFTPIGRGDGG